MRKRADQEPVALAKTKERGCTDPRVCAYHQACMGKCHLPLANATTAANLRHTDAAAAQRRWINLTDEEIESLWDHGLYVHCSGITALRAITRAIEAKLREKNT
jgi:hypothetical protein